LGLPVRSEEENRSIIGLGLKEALEHLYPEIPDNQLDKLILAYRDHYLAGDKSQPSQLYSGVQEVLDELRSQGHQLAVATGKSRRGLDRVLGELKMHHYFEHSRCADETRSKPHPLMLQEILQESGAHPRDAIMVGDTDFDLLMAKSASVQAIGVSYGAHPLDRIMQAEPHRIIDHISELLED
jgi:phosphoglycolate phosphatase